VADPDRLTRVQHRAVAALLTSRTVEQAATTAGVGERTVRRWLADPAFTEAYRLEARTAARGAMSDLLAGQREAVATLRRALVEGSPAQQVRAARALLEVGVRVREDDSDERLSAVEEVIRSWPDASLRGSRWPRPA